MMASLRLFSARKFLSETNLTKLKSAFSTSSVANSYINKNDDVNQIMKQKAELIGTDPFPDPRLKPVEFRVMPDDVELQTLDTLHEVYGIPEEHIKGRLVRVAKSPKSAMQSGTENTHAWILQFDTRQRWENELMGWVSSGDPLSNLQLRFHTKEQAIEYCQKYNFDYFVEKEKLVVPKKKSYASNFSWNKRSRVSTK